MGGKFSDDPAVAAGSMTRSDPDQDSGLDVDR